MKKTLLFTAVVALLCCGCDDSTNEPMTQETSQKFLATFENSVSRVYMGEDNFYRWESGDEVSVFTGDYSHRKYAATTGDVVTTGLEYVSTVLESDLALPNYNYAIFPFEDVNALESGVINSVIAAQQSYRQNGLNAAIMVSRAQASSADFIFKNSCALVKVNVKIAKDFSKLHSVKSITLTSKSNKLAGPVSVDVASGDYTAKVDASDEDASSSVTLTGCEAAGLLDSDSYLTYYLAIPAGTYPAGDLTISVVTSSTSVPFNASATLTKEHKVARSQYIELSTTIASDYQWVSPGENENEVLINDNVTLSDKAIMSDTEALQKFGWSGVDTYGKVFDIPSGDFTITGVDLVNAGVADDGPNGPTITFETTEHDVFIFNTLTTTTSGLKNTTDVNTVTMSNLTITGELLTTSMGVYVKGASYDQSKFHTVFNEVNFIDCKLMLANTNDKNLGCAVVVYGKAELNNCVLKGSTPSEYIASHYPEYADYPIYDMACTNASHTYINGGEVGTIFGWEQAKYTIGGGAKIGKLYTIGVSVNNLSHVEVNDATVDHLIFDPSGKYDPSVTLNAGAVVKVLEFVGVDVWSAVVINDGATVEKVVVDGNEMTLEEFIAQYKQPTA